MNHSSLPFLSLISSKLYVSLSKPKKNDIILSVSRCGGIAQWLEQSAHNRLVAGSNPAAPTRYFFVVQDYPSSNATIIGIVAIESRVETATSSDDSISLPPYFAAKSPKLVAVGSA